MECHAAPGVRASAPLCGAAPGPRVPVAHILLCTRRIFVRLLDSTDQPSKADQNVTEFQVRRHRHWATSGPPFRQTHAQASISYHLPMLWSLRALAAERRLPLPRDCRGPNRSGAVAIHAAARLPRHQRSGHRPADPHDHCSAAGGFPGRPRCSGDRGRGGYPRRGYPGGRGGYPRGGCHRGS